jgi:hypothetical protein
MVPMKITLQQLEGHLFKAGDVLRDKMPFEAQIRYRGILAIHQLNLNRKNYPKQLFNG